MSAEKKSATEFFQFNDDGIFPNSPLPVIIYRGVLFTGSEESNAESVKELFRKNNWMNAWENGVYSYHHYHSLTHEVLGVIKGETTLLLGGDNGKKVDVKQGDVVIIPAGVAHKNLTPEKDFSCIGAYPDGKEYDMNYGKPSERPSADKNMKSVPLPLKDPVSGASGDLFELWK